MSQDRAADYLAEHEADMRMIRMYRDIAARDGDTKAVAFMDAAINWFEEAALAAALILTERDDPCLDPRRN